MAEDTIPEWITELISDYDGSVQIEEQRTQLDELIKIYAQVANQDEELARKIRQIFIHILEKSPSILTEEKYSDFLARHIKPEDLAHLQWEAPHHVISFWENLYSLGIQKEMAVEHFENQTATLLRYALQQFEHQQAFEKMFQLLQLAPISPSLTDPELLRLHDRAYLYEMRRVQRNRRWLFAYLILQIFLILGVFPFLFINAENGRIQDQIEEVAEVDLPEEPKQFLSYSDGLYWSLITAGSIGYGDITPKTRDGKMIASALGVMGVITAGVIAGLILQWITPRRLE